MLEKESVEALRWPFFHQDNLLATGRVCFLWTAMSDCGWALTTESFLKHFKLRYGHWQVLFPLGERVWRIKFESKLCPHWFIVLWKSSTSLRTQRNHSITECVEEWLHRIAPNTMSQKPQAARDCDIHSVNINDVENMLPHTLMYSGPSLGSLAQLLLLLRTDRVFHTSTYFTIHY
jgi:hypothetical protein